MLHNKYAIISSVPVFVNLLYSWKQKLVRGSKYGGVLAYERTMSSPKKPKTDHLTPQALELRRSATHWLHLIIHGDRWQDEFHYVFPWPQGLATSDKYTIAYDGPQKDCPITKIIEGDDEEDEDDDEDTDWCDTMKATMDRIGGFDVGDQWNMADIAKEPDFPKAVHRQYHYTLS